MNPLTAWIAWCLLQVTLFAIASAVLYLVARRLVPAAGAALLGGSLTLVVALTLLAGSPWPRWQWSTEDNADAASTAAVAGVESSAAATPTAATTTDVDAPSPYAAAWQAFRNAFATPALPAGAEPVQRESAGVWYWWLLIGGCFAASAGRLAWGVWQVRGLLRGSAPLADERLAALAAPLQTQLRVPPAVGLRESPEIVTPATIGWRRQHILLPASWRQWSDDEVRAVLAHEFSHVAARDYRSWLVARLAVAVHFYHPIVRWLASRLQLEQELAADATAARLMGDRVQYLQCLASLALATPPHRLAGPARTLIPSRSLLMRRVEMLRTATDLRSRFGSSRRLRGACVGVLAVMAIAIAGVRRPESGVAAEAGSSSPPAAVAAKPVERIPLSLVPADTVYAVSVRPAELLENELYGPLVSEIDELKPLAESSVSVRDIAEFMVIVPGSPYAQERFVVRFASQQACLDFVNAMLQRQQFEGAVDPNGPWRDGSEQITKVDQSTLAIEHFATPEAHGASLPPLHSHLVHGWAEAWQQRAEQPWVAAISVAALRQAMPPEVREGLYQNGMMQTLAPLLDGTDWAVAGIDLDTRLALDAVVQCKGDSEAKQAANIMQSYITLGAGVVQFQRNEAARQLAKLPPEQAEVMRPLTDKLFSIAEEFAANAKPTAEGDRVSLVFRSDSLTEQDAALTAQMLLPAVKAARAAATRARSANNLKNIALAVHNYHDAYGHFPPAVLHSQGSPHPYSWRVALLPFLEQQALYNAYRFDEPWDSEANKQVLQTVVPVFQSPFDEPSSHNASYFALTGPDTVFHGDEGTRITAIRDGTSGTIMFVEAKRDVPWTKPEDIPYVADKPLPELGGWMPGIFLAALCDASVRVISQDVDPDVLRGMITRDGREVIELP